MRSWPAPQVPRIDIESPGAPEVVQVHDTSTGRLEPAGPGVAEGVAARLYVCGITPYDATHLGHANTYLTFDLLNRAWRDLGLEVQYTQNNTDVDDPLLERATRDGIDWRDLAQGQTDLFRRDMEALRVLPPQDYLGATETIDWASRAIEKLAEKGAAYQLEGDEFADWYFDVTSDSDFMRVSHLDEQQAMARFTEMGGDPDRPGKRNRLDPLVWRQARPGEPSWHSSLGNGRPGWHIECTAIALDTLGTDFHVQGGGSDLAFPHHEMSAAHAQVLTGERFAQSYVHSGLVALEGEKMSKSRGNLELVSRLLQQGADPMAIRLAMLGHHWREDWEWDGDQLTAATKRLGRWRQVTAEDATLDVRPLLETVRTALRADLDAPSAIASIDAWVDASLAVKGDDTEGPAVLGQITDALLGVEL